MTPHICRSRGPRRVADAYAELPTPQPCRATTFASEDYDVRMEYAGLARSFDRVVFRGDPGAREFIAFWLLEDRVVAGMNVNVSTGNAPSR